VIGSAHLPTIFAHPLDVRREGDLLNLEDAVDAHIPE